MRPFDRRLVVLTVAAALLVVAVTVFRGSDDRSSAPRISFSALITRVGAGDVSEVVVADDRVTGHFSDGQPFSAYLPPGSDGIDRLTDFGVQVTVLESSDRRPSHISILIGWLPMLMLTLCLWILIARAIVLYLRRLRAQ